MRSEVCRGTGRQLCCCPALAAWLLCSELSVLQDYDADEDDMMAQVLMRSLRDK